MPNENKELLVKKLQDLLREGDAILDNSYDKIECRCNEITLGIKLLPNEVAKCDEEFENLTQIKENDIRFLMFACILQAVRIVIMEHYQKRLPDKESAEKTIGHKEEHSNRSTRRYYASLEEIKNNPVPFDCIMKEDVVKRNGNPKLSGFNHRFKTLGHDPYLGFVFGTMNIMTKTITVTNGWGAINTYHVHTGTRIVQEKAQNIDKICAQASTAVMFEKLYKRFQEEGSEAWKALGVSLWKEWVHLHSDIRTAKSLPIPIVSSISPNAARIMQAFGIDYLNVKIIEKEAFLSILINEIIKKIHKLCYDKSKDGTPELFSVRTTKIIDISNEMVTICSAMVSVVRAYLGDVDAIKKFDYGGAAVTLWHVLNDPIKIAEIKHEYIIKKTSNYISNI